MYEYDDLQLTLFPLFHSANCIQLTTTGPLIVLLCPLNVKGNVAGARTVPHYNIPWNYIPRVRRRLDMTGKSLRPP